MGQEILYCNKCGKRLVGDDFTRGRAHTYNNLQYCTKCLPQRHAAAPQEESRRKSSTGRRVKPPTARASRAPDKSGAMLLGGAGFGIAAAGVIAVVLMSRPSTPPPPEPVVVKHVPVPAPPPVPAGPSKEKLAEDLKELEGKVQKLVAAEQFVAAVDLLGEARKRYSVPEWDQPIAKRLKEVQDLPAGLYPSLKERAAGAHLRGATADVQQERARVDRWGRKDLLDDLDKALAQIVPREPLPAGATVLVRFPDGDVSRYRTTGEFKDGAIVGLLDLNTRAVGFESGNEIFKVPEEGEIRLVYSTTSPKLLTVTVRAFAPDGKNYPFNFWLEKPEVGRPHAIKFPVAVLKNWSQQPITKGGKVDNVYVRQDDPAAVLKVHEFVIFATKP